MNTVKRSTFVDRQAVVFVNRQSVAAFAIDTTRAMRAGVVVADCAGVLRRAVETGAC